MRHKFCEEKIKEESCTDIEFTKFEFKNVFKNGKSTAPGKDGIT